MLNDCARHESGLATAHSYPSVEALRAFGVYALGARDIGKRQPIYSAGEIANTMALLVEGFAFKFAEVGAARQILHFFVPGDIIDQGNVVISNAPILFSTHALTQARIFEFDADAYRNLIKGDARARHFLRSRFQQRQTLWAKHMVDLGMRNASGRLASFISEIRDRLGLDQATREFAFPFHQRDLADALGLTVAHVNRTLKGMSDCCEIDWKLELMRIKDPEALSALLGVELAKNF